MLAFTRGDIILVDLDGSKGHETANDKTIGARPCLVIQNDTGNKFSPLTIIAPITGMDQFKNLPVQVAVTAAELGAGGSDSSVELGQIKTVDRETRVKKVLGRLADKAIERVDNAIRKSLGI